MAPSVSSLKILLGALAIIPLRFVDFARATAFPFVLYLCVTSIWFFESAVDFYNAAGWPMLLVTESVNVILYTLAAVATHRLVLLGPSALPRSGIEWGHHTTRFLIYAFAYAIAGYAIPFGASWITVTIPYLAIALFLLALYLISRLSLVFPASAIGRPISLRESWKLTQSRKLLMFLIAIVYPVFVVLPITFITSDSYVGYFIQLLLGFLALIVTVVLLSFAYQQVLKDLAGAA